MVEGFLRDRRALLIWDNFESVRSVPDPSAATPPLDEAGCQQLRGFLQQAGGGRAQRGAGHQPLRRALAR